MRAAAKMLRGAKRMTVASAAGTKLDIDMAGASTVGVWGWTDRPGTLAHWPGGIVVSFPKSGTVNGTLVLDRGDINLTFKRYLEAPMRLTLEEDYVTRIEGEGADAEMMRGYLAAWGDREAYAVSHVGFGMNPQGALRGARHVRPARHQRHRAARRRRQFPVLHRRQRVRRPLHRRPFRHPGDADHDYASTAPRWCAPACCRSLFGVLPLPACGERGRRTHPSAK